MVQFIREQFKKASHTASERNSGPLLKEKSIKATGKRDPCMERVS
jgi:hypothetical protein